MLVLGLGLKAKFCGLGLGTVTLIVFGLDQLALALSVLALITSLLIIDGLS